MTRKINHLLWIAGFGTILVTACSKKKEVVIAPTLTTTAITNVTYNSATSGGTITSNGGAAITASGICWGTNSSPTVANDTTLGHAGTGSFVANLKNLQQNVIYYVRAYARNSAGVGYGNILAFSTSTDTAHVTFTYMGQAVTYGVVTSPITGRKWMDRNLGASEAATSMLDTSSYGDLFEWGRLPDGHQKRWSDTTSVWATTPVPGNNKFIIAFNVPNNPYGDWLIPPSNALWQGSHGINNPCPPGWHVPAQSEWQAETGMTNDTTAYSSSLKLPAAGYRNPDGSLGGLSTKKHGQFWTSTPDGTTDATDNHVYIFTTGATYVSAVGATSKATGASVRCIKD